MASEATFNVNDHVWVRLTDEGREYHRRWYGARYPMLPYRTPDESNNGWSRWQLWDLMASFGDGIHMGGRVPFETTIRLKEPVVLTNPTTQGIREP